MSNEQKNCDKLSTLLDKTAHNLVKVAMLFRFPLDEKTSIKIVFPN